MISRCPTLSFQVRPDFTTTVLCLNANGTCCLARALLPSLSSAAGLPGRTIVLAPHCRDLQVKFLPELAFFALWDTPILGTPALISEHLQDETEEDSSDGENPGGPLPGANEMPTTSPTVPKGKFSRLPIRRPS